jgi:hypothetical protein
MKKRKKKENDLGFDFMKTNKDNIKNIIKDRETIILINDLVINTNKIVIHAYNFIKLYVLYLYEKDKEIPLIDKEFICDVFKVITIRKCNSGGYRDDNMPEQLKQLTKFYQKHYQQTVDKDEVLYYDKMSYILAYEAIDMETNINNNIQEHFIQHINKFVNITFDLNERREDINKMKVTKEEKKNLRKELNKEFSQIKYDLISLEKELKSDKKYHRWIKKQRKYINDGKETYDHDNIYYDLKSNTQDYLRPMIYIDRELEKINDQIKINNENNDENQSQIKLFNTLPLRTNIIPKNITIDTCGLIQNLITDVPTGPLLKNYKKDDNQNNLWERFFKLNKRIFKKNKYQFHYMIRTDGISVSVLFIRLKDGVPMKKPKNITRFEEQTQYIEKVEFTEEMKKKKIVCIDPNYSDLIYCGMRTKNGNLKTFRYTQNQRRLETGLKKYRHIIDTNNKNTKINNKTIKEIESELSNYSKKTNNYRKFKEYITKKNEINLKLFNHYQQAYFRKFKLNRFINTQKSESKMIMNFENKFGLSDKVIIAMGDYDKTEHMRGLEPVICKKFRRLFKNAGYETYLINEFRTSKLCNECNEEVDKFLVRKSHKPKDMKENKQVTVNGLLRHMDVKHKCEIIHNRDKNAVQNMLNIVEHIKKKGKRPKMFTRDQNSFPLHDGI